MSRPQPEDSIHISDQSVLIDIALKIRQRSKKTFDHITFETQTGSFKREVLVNLSPGNVYKEVFNPAFELSVRDQLLLFVEYPSRVRVTERHAKLTIIVEPSKVMIEAQDDHHHGRKTYFKRHKDIEVTIGLSSYSAPGRCSHDALSPLPSTTGEILNICPRFRLLIIGNSGVGKSTLIEKVFGVEGVVVSDKSRGDARIDKEFVAKDNGLFVLHDSLGLEAGESKNFDEIQRFIRDRRKMRRLEDRLHAVWVCLAIPYANGRFLETGIEDFLRDKKRILGDIPIIAVLTKLDLLDSRLLQEHCISGSVKNLEEARLIIEPHKTRFLDEHCTKRLPKGIPHVAVSTKKGFGLESTISELIEITTSEIERYVKVDPSHTEMAEQLSLEHDAPFYIAGMAQRASTVAKVDFTITLAKKRYWRNLGTLTFSTEKVKKDLLVVHEDIIQVWNFNDPEMVLRGDGFKEALFDTSTLVADSPSVKTTLQPAMAYVSGVSTFMNSLAITPPIPSTGASQTIVKCFMGYIVDLTYVMKILFILAPEKPITSEDVALALEVYEKSSYRNRVLLQIRDFCASFKIVPGYDAVMEIGSLINRYGITDEEVVRIRRQIQPANVEAVAIGSHFAHVPVATTNWLYDDVLSLNYVYKSQYRAVCVSAKLLSSSEQHPGCSKSFSPVLNSSYHSVKQATTKDEEMSAIKDRSSSLGSSIPDTHSESKRCALEQVNEPEIVITTIRTTDVAVNLRRIPAGFYTAVRHSGLEWRTSNDLVLVNNDVIEWHSPIPIPCDLSTPVHLGVYATFEFQPILGQGEMLRDLTINVQRLLDLNEKGLPLAFHPVDGGVRSPCSSLLVTVQRRRRESGNSPAWRVLDPHCSITETLSQLEEATNHGHSALSRYLKYREIQDLEYSIQLFKRALDNCPLGDPCRAAAVANLAMAEFTRCQADDSDASLDVPISLCWDALAIRHTTHPDRPSTLIRLADVHFARFKNKQNADDAAQAVALLREAVKLSSVERYENQTAISALRLHALDLLQMSGSSATAWDFASGLTDKDPWILDLSTLLLYRFEQFGDLADLQHAITVLRASISAQGQHYPALLGNLGVALFYRFGHLAQLDDLEQAIQKQGDAVDSIPDGHTAKSRHLSHLGNFFLARFECLGKLIDLEQAILKHRDAVDLTSNTHPDKPAHLNNLATSFRTRYVHLNRLADLEEAISVHKEAIELTPDGNRNKPGYLNNLAISFRSRFKQLNELCDLEAMISMHREAIEITPDGNCHKHTYLNNLAASLLTRFVHLGELSDVEQAISVHTESIELVPTSHPIKPKYLNDLANSFRTRFEYFGELSDLEQAISNHREAIALAGPNRYNHAYLNSLSTSFLARFKRLGESNDLEEAISGHKKAIELIAHDRRCKPAYLNDLATSLLARFQCLDEPDRSDLEQAILMLREAIALSPDSGPDKPDFLNNLGICLRTRFTHYGQPNDLKEAISMHMEAVRLASGGRTNKSNVRKNSVPHFAHRRSSQQSDLDPAIWAYKEAVRLISDRHPDKYCHLNNLANCLLVRFEHSGKLSDLEEAALMQRTAVQLKNASSSATPCL